MAKKPYIDHWSLKGNPINRIQRVAMESGRVYYDGVVATQYGYVDAYAQSDFSNFRFIRDGIEYSCTVRRGYTQRGVARVAHRLAKEWSRRAPKV